MGNFARILLLVAELLPPVTAAVLTFRQRRHLTVELPEEIPEVDSSR